MSNNNQHRDKAGRFTYDPGKRLRLVLDELHRAFDHFNKTFADDKLPKVVITIQESGRKNALGWYGKGFWADTACGTSACEINISAEHMNRSANSILETLLHEMAHLHNSINNIRDVSSGQYHNKRFKEAAEKFGLKVTRYGNRGWAETALNEPADEAIKELEPNVDILTSLKRKTRRVIREKRYISLIVSADLEQDLIAAREASGMSQREFVEQALQDKINNWVQEEVLVS